MRKVEYKYYILKERWLARLEKNQSDLSSKEFYKNGKWEQDEKLNLILNDCIMDYGDGKWYDYDKVSEIEAMAFIKSNNLVNINCKQKERRVMDWSIMSLSGERDINEDSAKVIDNGEVKCFVVADGLGGHGKGDEASALACGAFEEAFAEVDDKSLFDLLSLAFNNAQTKVLEKQIETGAKFQMKTTACALAIKQNEVVWGHIGDSRLYAFSRNKIKVRTTDHSVPQMLVLSKEIKEKDIRNHPDRNKLLRVLGVPNETPKFEISKMQKLKKYQAFLLCSDGFWELILEKEMETLLKESGSAKEWLYKMFNIVLERGNDTNMDNATAIAVFM